MRKTLFSRKFSAAHRLWNDPSECKRIHGHNYRADILVSVSNENKFMSVPADKVKEVVDRKYDHRLILSRSDPVSLTTSRPSVLGFGEDPEANVDDWVVRVEGNPSTEILAHIIAKDVRSEVTSYQGNGTHGWVEVDLFETDTIMATARVEW
jgi:6-pyruvoyl-tetrahydropterin synthase